MQVANLLESRPLAERPSLWEKLHEKAVSSMTEMGDVPAAIATLPREQQFAAVTTAIEQLTRLDRGETDSNDRNASQERAEYSQGAAARVLESISLLDRTEALEAIALADATLPFGLHRGDAVTAAAIIGREDLPNYIRQVSAYPQTGNKFDILRAAGERSMNLADSDAEKVETMSSLLQEAASSQASLDSLASLWIMLPSGGAKSVAAQVSPDLLARYLLGAADRSDVDAIINRSHLLETIAARTKRIPDRFRGCDGVKDSNTLTKIYSAWARTGSLTEVISPLLADSSNVDTFTHSMRTAISIISELSDPLDKQRALDLVDATAASADSRGARNAFGVGSGISEAAPVPSDLDADKSYWQSDNKFLYEYLAQHADSSPEAISSLIRVGNAWRASASIFPAIHEAMSTPGPVGRDTPRGVAEQMAYSIFLHARRNSEKIMDDYAQNAFSGQWSATELKTALSHLSDYVKRGSSLDRSETPPANSDHALVTELVDHDFQNVRSADVANAVAFASAWRTTGSLMDGWRATHRNAHRPDSFHDRYLVSTVARIARNATFEQQKDFVRQATERVFDPTVSTQEAAELSSVLHHRFGREQPSLLVRHDGEDSAASGLIGALTQNSNRMSAEEMTQTLQIAREFLSGNSAEELLASIDRATAKPPEDTASFDCMAQMVGTLPAAAQEAFAAKAAEPLLQRGTSDALLRSRIDLLSAMARNKVAPQLLGSQAAADLAVNVTRALTTGWRVNLPAAKLALSFGQDRLAGESLVESWNRTVSIGKGDQLADAVVLTITKLSALASAVEKQAFRVHLENRLFNSANISERAVALSVLDAMVTDQPEVFSGASGVSETPQAVLNAAQIKDLAKQTEHADGDQLVRLLDQVKVTVLAPSLESSFDAAISNVDQAHKFGHLAKMIAARAAEATPDQLRALLQHMDASIDTGTVDQAQTALEIGVKLLRNHPELFVGCVDAPALMGTLTNADALRSTSISANDPDYVRQVIAGMRKWHSDHNIGDLVASALSGPERSAYTKLKLLTNLMAEQPNVEREAAANAIVAHINSNYSVSDFANLQHTVTGLYAGKCPESFIRQLASQAQNTQNDFAWRLGTINYLSKLKLHGEVWPANMELPSVRMPAMEGLDRQHLENVRQQVESAFVELFTHPESAIDRMRTMIDAGGELGKLLPSVFGNYEKTGGIVGRPQSGESDATLDQRTIEAIENVVANKATESLSEKERINLLWATLLHGVGSLPGAEQAEQVEQDHTSGEIAWGVLQTLGYPAQRISRIVDLISKRTEAMRIRLDEKTDDGRLVPNLWAQEANDRIIVGTRHPAFPQQWRILNEGVLRSTNPSAFTPETDRRLEDVTAIMQREAANLSRYSLPLLSSTVPRKFGFHYKPDNYAFMMHRTASISDFFDLLGSAESKEFSMSATLVTPKVQRFVFRDTAPFKLIVGAPWENIAQAYRGDLYTGMGVGWQVHARAARYWLGEHTVSKPRRFESVESKLDRENQKRSLVGKTFAAEVDQRLQAIGFGDGQQPNSALKQARLALSQFDTLDELQATAPPGDPLRSAHDVMVTALTYWEDGQAQTKHNEIKVANPSILGVAAFRRAGQKVSFVGVEEALVNQLFADSERPEWVLTGAEEAPDALAIPPAVVQTLAKHKLPLVILDWTREDLDGPMFDDF